MRQTHRFALLLLIALGTWSEALVETVVGQTAAPSETPRSEVALLNLYPPVYPPLARQARIMGEVKIQLEIRPVGSVASAEVMSGHPMLKQAALDSAQKSTFECRGCGDPVTSYPMTYTFGFQDDGGCNGILEDHHVRCARCLYLWRCGLRSSMSERVPVYRDPEVTQSQGHATLLVSSVCVDTETATTR